jgi:hypothetical protein
MLATLRVAMVDILGKEAWGADDGLEAFGKLDALLRERSEPLVNLSMNDVQRLDASCSREVIASVIQRYRGVRCFFLSGVNSKSLKENVDAALARKNMRMLLRLPSGGYELLGVELKSHLVQTLDVLEQHGQATSRQICAAIENLTLTACNNRLKDLSDDGLIMKVEGAAESGGKEYLYVALR